METQTVELVKAEKQFLIQEQDIDIHDTSWEEQCMHMPDKLEFIQQDISGDRIMMEYDCKGCGKRVQEVFTYSETIEK